MSVIVCAEVSFSKNRIICITNQLTGFLVIGAFFTGKYLRTEHFVFSEIPFNENSHYTETIQIIYIANQLTSFCKAQVFTKRHFQRYTTVCS